MFEGGVPLSGDFKGGVFSCCDDMNVCCQVYCLMCFSSAQLSEKVQFNSFKPVLAVTIFMWAITFLIGAMSQDTNMGCWEQRAQAATTAHIPPENLFDYIYGRPLTEENCPGSVYLNGFFSAFRTIQWLIMTSITYIVRQKVRVVLGIGDVEKTTCEDVCCSACCMFCVQCQLARTVYSKERGCASIPSTLDSGAQRGLMQADTAAQ
jgi:Cys-rich protein (TIGR01571 family)